MPYEAFPLFSCGKMQNNAYHNNKNVKEYPHMKNKTDTAVINSPENKEIHLFAAANTENGFISFFDKAFFGEKAVINYILKGGPGSGKSTIMKNYAKHAEKNGLTPIYYHCSSDPYSLDGVTVKETGISVIDGTSPHAVEPAYPGVRDFYVDLSPAWNTSVLAESSDKIISLAKAKSDCYKTAYRLLEASGKIEREMHETAKSFVDCEKIRNFTDRFFKKYIKSKTPKHKTIKEVVVSAVSAKGFVRYFTLEKYAKNLFFIKESKKVEDFLFEELAEMTKKSGASAVFALSPENPKKVVGILFPENDICISLYDSDMVSEFEASGKTVKFINSTRFINPDAFGSCRQKFRFSEKCFDTLRSAAISELSRAGAFHAALEEIYISATDYNKVTEISEILYR